MTANPKNLESPSRRNLITGMLAFAALGLKSYKVLAESLKIHPTDFLRNIKYLNSSKKEFLKFIGDIESCLIGGIFEFDCKNGLNIFFHKINSEIISVQLRIENRCLVHFIFDLSKFILKNVHLTAGHIDFKKLGLPRAQLNSLDLQSNFEVEDICMRYLNGLCFYVLPKG
jgi:hypothetical protein